MLSVPRAREVAENGSETMGALVPPVELRDSFKKGVHTISGSVMAPDACTTVSADASVDETKGSPHILVTLSLPPDNELCLVVPTKQSFSVSATAPQGVPIEVRINGMPATTTNL